MNKSKDKIISYEDAINIVENLKNHGKTIVNVHGCFDLFHYGHLKFFESAKKNGDILLVSVTPDVYISKGPNRPVFKERQRIEFLSNIDIVDYVVLNTEADAVNFLKDVKPQLTARGSEYSKVSEDITGNILLEKNAIESVGGKLIIIDEPIYSSTALIKDFKLNEDEEIDHFSKIIKEKFDKEDFSSLVEKISKTKVSLIGDMIRDEYVFCNIVGTVTKHTALSGLYKSSLNMDGGAYAIAKNLAQLCQEVNFYTILGDKNNNFNLKNEKIKIFYETDDKNYTPHKVRFISSGYPNLLTTLYKNDTLDTSNRIFEIGYMPSGGWPENTVQKLSKRFVDEGHSRQLTMVADFGHGVLSEDLINKLSSLSDKYICLNVQTNSANFGFNLVTKYKHADFICIDELELRLAFSDKKATVEDLIKKLSEKLSCKKIMITRGKQGIVYFLNNKYIYAPALAKNIVDAVGAGDAVFVGASIASLYDNEGYMTVLIGSIMGMLSTKIVANSRVITKGEMIKSALSLI